MPGFAVQHQINLRQQARHPHGLIWDSRGSSSHDEIAKAFEKIVERLNICPTDALFFCQRTTEMCTFGKLYLIGGKFEKRGCLVFRSMCDLPQTTLNKAVIFGLWLE